MGDPLKWYFLQQSIRVFKNLLLCIIIFSSEIEAHFFNSQSALNTERRNAKLYTEASSLQ